MAIRKVGKRRYGGVRRRRYGGGRRRANRTGGLVTNRMTSLVPDRMILRMRYRDNKLLNLSAPDGHYDYRLNSIYDPDVSLVAGHQPLGYDQWAVFYTKYRVFRADVKCTFVNTNPVALGGMQVGLIPFNSQSLLPEDDSTFEQPHATSKILGNTTGMDKAVVKRSVDIPRIVGKSHLSYKGSDNTSAQFGFNPQEQVWVRFAAQNINSGENISCQMIIEITYHVELFDRIQQQISIPDYKESSPSLMQ